MKKTQEEPMFLNSVWKCPVTGCGKTVEPQYDAVYDISRLYGPELEEIRIHLLEHIAARA